MEHRPDSPRAEIGAPRPWHRRVRSRLARVLSRRVAARGLRRAGTRVIARLLPSGLRTRLLLLILFAVLPSLAITIHLAMIERASALRIAAWEALDLARVAASEQGQVLQAARELLVGMMETRALQDRSPRASRLLFARVLEEHPPFTTLAAADPWDRVFASDSPGGASADVAGTSWFRLAASTGRFAVGEYEVDPRTRRGTITCASPIRDRKGRLRAVVFAHLDLDSLDRRAAGLALPPGAEWVTLDRRGTVIASAPDPARWVSRPFPRTRTARVRVSPGRELSEMLGFDRVTRLYAFEPLASVPDRALRVGVGLPRGALFGEADRALRRSLLLLALLGGLVLLVAWRGAHHVVLRRVEALVRATRALRAGDHTARTGIPYGAGELSQLSRAFDEMAAALERRRREHRREMRALRESGRRLRAVLETALDGIVAVDDSGAIVEFNPAAERMFGRTRSEVVGASIVDLLIAPRQRETFRRALLERGEAGQGVRTELHAIRADGSEFPIEISVSPAYLVGRRRLLTLSVRDISDHKRHEQALRMLSMVDELTRLYNRRGFLTFAEQQLRMAQRSGSPVWLMFADVDDFKQINDRHGHDEGDRALQEVARLMREVFRRSDVIARFGGDEFVVLAVETSRPGAERLAMRLQQHLEARGRAGDKPYALSVSIGRAFYDPARPCSIEELIKRADARMYDQKQRRRPVFSA